MASNTQHEYYNDLLPLNAMRFQGDLLITAFDFITYGSVVRQTPSGRITVADFSNNGIYFPIGLAATDDSLWVSDWGTGIVWQLYADGILLPYPTPVATGLSSPEGLAIAPDGNLLVVESGTGSLSRINLGNGEAVKIVEGLELGFARNSNQPQGFFNGVAVGPSGAIYVTGDKANVLYRIEIHQ
jgi:DNA-binding beta-propeller fold protein YncE